MDVLTLVLFGVGLVLLVFGADYLVKGASHLAGALGISPLIVGLTVVAFGTSAPEMAVSTASAWNGSADIAVGNVVGSNIFNVLFILGVSALIVPLVVSQQLIRLDVPIMIAASLLVWWLARDGALGRLEAMLLFASVVAYTVFLIVQSRRETAEIKAEYAEGVEVTEPDGRPHWALNVFWVVLGLAMLVLGSRWLVDGAVQLARGFGVSELVIGLTIVAAGTSLPEVATSIMAGLKGERDIAVGNVVGSNIFNLLAVLGVAGLVSPGPVPVSANALAFDIPFMTAVAVACLPVFFAGRIITRWNGALFLGYYVAYTCYLVFSAVAPPTAETLFTVMLSFVLPLTLLTLMVGVLREWRAAHTPSR